MIRALLIAAVSAAMLGACTQHSTSSNPDTGYRHGGTGPSFSSRILP